MASPCRMTAVCTAVMRGVRLSTKHEGPRMLMLLVVMAAALLNQASPAQAERDLPGQPGGEPLNNLVRPGNLTAPAPDDWVKQQASKITSRRIGGTPPPINEDWCGTEIGTEEEVAAAQAAFERALAQRASSRKYQLPKFFTIKVIFHVIQLNSDTPGANGAVYYQSIVKQVEVLNILYRNTAFKFKLDEDRSRRYNDPTCYYLNIGATEYDACKAKYRKGTKYDLNVYTAAPYRDGSSGTLLGIATFPWRLMTGSGAGGAGSTNGYDGLKSDGVTLLWETLPDTGNTDFIGITAVHEVGHWLGLYHPWQPQTNSAEGGCEAGKVKFVGGTVVTLEGDLVSDTPRQKAAVYDCDFASDTCPSYAGKDPIDVFMAYTDDVCLANYGRWTKGQISRMRNSWLTWRFKTPIPSATTRKCKGTLLKFDDVNLLGESNRRLSSVAPYKGFKVSPAANWFVMNNKFIKLGYGPGTLNGIIGKQALFQHQADKVSATLSASGGARFNLYSMYATLGASLHDETSGATGPVGVPLKISGYRGTKKVATYAVTIYGSAPYWFNLPTTFNNINKAVFRLGAGSIVGGGVVYDDICAKKLVATKKPTKKPTKKKTTKKKTTKKKAIKKKKLL